MNPPIDTILVPQGAEYQAVAWGWRRAGAGTPPAIAIPAGVAPVEQFLAQSRLAPEQRALLLGLGGALAPGWPVGAVGLYERCIRRSPPAQRYTAAEELLAWLETIVPARRATGFTSDRLIARARDKQALGRDSQAALVDMESAPVLAYFQQAAVLRVVSDDWASDVPDLAAAFDTSGRLQPLPLAWGLARQPRTATRLVRGSLRGLQVLARVAEQLARAWPRETRRRDCY